MSEGVGGARPGSPSGRDPDEAARRSGALLRRGERRGCPELSELQRAVEQLALDDDETAALYGEIAERGIEVRDDCGNGADRARFGNGELAAATSV